jgi:HKD family nuclease
MFEAAESSVKIISPFIGTDMARLLVDNMNSNPVLEVEIITRFYREDFINGVSKIAALEKLNDAGAKIYALIGLHTKLYLFDAASALLGSANFTSGGFKLNHELSLCVTDEHEVNPQLAAYFDDLVKAINQSGDFLLTAEKIAEEKALVTSLLEKRTDKGTTYRNEKRFGAELSAKPQATDAEQSDTIQTILSESSHAEYSETIWLKFEGESRFRYNLTERYSPNITSQFPGGITNYPTSRKPSVAEGDYIYMAVVCMDERGNPMSPHIVGRGRSEGYHEGNIATPDMIVEQEWMARFSHYCLFTEFEYLDAPILEGIPLSRVLQDVGSNTYVSTMGQSLPLADLRIRHHQKAHLRLTAQAKNYIDGLFDDLIEKHGVLRTSAAPTFVNRSTQQRTDSGNSITDDMIKISYEVAKKVYEGSIGNTQGRDMLETQAGMNRASAGDFIYNFRAMMDGAEYHRTLSGKATRYYFENILSNFGDEGLKKALSACRMHVQYYSALGYGNLRGIERIIKEFERKLET